MTTRLTPELKERYRRLWPQRTVCDLLDAQADRRGAHPALSDAEQQFTFQQLRDRVDQVARGLLGLGIAAGDRVAIHLPNCAEYIIAVLAIARIGAISVLLHLPYRESELDYALPLTAPQAAIIPGAYRGHDYPGMYARLQQRCPELRHLIVVGAEPPAGAVRFDRLRQDLATDLAPRRPDPDAVFCMCFTSGTTGNPKAAMHTHNTMLAAFNCRDLWGMEAGDTILVPSPLSHTAPLGVGLLMMMLYAGGHALIMERWDCSAAIGAIERHQVNYLIGPPAYLVDIANTPDLDPRRLRSIKSLLYAGAPCPIEVARSLRSQLACQISTVYGTTETGFLTCTRFDDDLETVCTTIGRPIPHLEFALRDPDGHPVPAGQVGELWVRGPNLFIGYYRRPEATAARFDEQGWLRTGDLMYSNPWGNFHYMGRADDLINRGGMKIDPREVEEVLLTHPAIREAAVVSMPDHRLGERPCAFVVARDQAAIDLAAVVAYLTDRGLAKYKLPDRLEQVDGLPYTFTGKLQRNVLRERLRAGSGP